VSVAGHPEGHPYLDAGPALATLKGWRDWGEETRIDVSIVSQFCFESAPILGWMKELDAYGIDVPVIVGLAGPATPATLMKFALRCGVGNSMRAVRSQIGRFGRLLTDTGPDHVVRSLSEAPSAATASVTGFHFFPFGGLRKAAHWLRDYKVYQALPEVAEKIRLQSNPENS
jgi:methylenetetrahydrofolate reductase (NADPH)